MLKRTERYVGGSRNGFYTLEKDQLQSAELGPLGAACGLAMKNQYFGDINDYRKYGLLRAIVRCSRLRLLVAWMLTPDDGSTDGKFISYLESPAKWARHDPVLFEGLKALVASAPKREVRLIESSELIGQAGYFSRIVPDAAVDRLQWFESLENPGDVVDKVNKYRYASLHAPSSPH